MGQRLHGQDPLKVSHQPTKFGGPRQGGNGNIMILVCHVILQDHVIKGTCGYRSWSPSRKVAILPCLVAIGTMVLEISWF